MSGPKNGTGNEATGLLDTLRVIRTSSAQHPSGVISGRTPPPTITLNQAVGDLYIFRTGYPTTGNLFHSHFTAS